MRGDVPTPVHGWPPKPRFSPRARGCSCCRHPPPCSTKVFPACAGMFRHGANGGDLWGCFPRVRGDVPTCTSVASSPSTFSPRARGCSHPCHRRNPIGLVFPACAGMFQAINELLPQAWGFPRVRGDVPPHDNFHLLLIEFSPRARGCSPDTYIITTTPTRFPRVRGDVPPP